MFLSILQWEQQFTHMIQANLTCEARRGRTIALFWRVPLFTEHPSLSIRKAETSPVVTDLSWTSLRVLSFLHLAMESRLIMAPSLLIAIPLLAYVLHRLRHHLPLRRFWTLRRQYWTSLITSSSRVHQNHQQRLRPWNHHPIRLVRHYLQHSRKPYHQQLCQVMSSRSARVTHLARNQRFSKQAANRQPTGLPLPPRV